MNDTPAQTPLNPRTLEPGLVIDGFRLLERRHQGGMAVLWRVEPAGAEVPPGTGPLLMKIPLFGRGEERSAIIGFEVEQMILPRLSGPHIPRIHALGDFARLPHIVMEEIAGESLQARLSEPFPVEAIAPLGAEIARALADLHRQRTVHLDLKPANILFRPDGTAVLIDFGLSAHADLPDLLAEESDQPMGTGAYIAPEQIEGQRSDPRSDLFALGVILYRLATGIFPFGEPDSAAGMRRRLTRPPLPPRNLRHDLPAGIEAVILRALAAHPTGRQQSAAQLAFDLRNPDQAPPAPPPPARPGLLGRLLGSPAADPASEAAARLTRPAPIVLAALDLSGPKGPLDAAIRLHVLRVLEAERDARLACVTVLRTSLLSLDEDMDAEGRTPYIERLVALKDWAHPLGIHAERASFHVLEAVNPAAAIVEYARHNGVDHVVMGARGHSTLRRYLGSVSSEVVAEAPCTVTVVRS